MAWLRSVGRREQAALKAVVVKLLAGCKNLSLESRRREERIDTYRGVVPNVAHFLVVCAVGKQQLFVCPKESCVRAAVIPDERAPASGFANYLMATEPGFRWAQQGKSASRSLLLCAP